MANPILLNVPEKLETPRLQLRCPYAGDGRLLHEAFHASKDRLTPWFQWAAREHTLESEEQFVREQAARFQLREMFTYFLHQPPTGHLLGAIALYPRDWSIPVFELGYWLRTGEEGKGYMSEAVNCLTHMAFDVLDAERVIIRADERNLRSQAVALRCGYQYEATFRDVYTAWDHDGLATLKVFSIIKNDYNKNNENPSQTK